jgi:hypothetical protein
MTNSLAFVSTAIDAATRQSVFRMR